MVLAVRFRDAVALAGLYPLLAGADLDVLTGEIVVLKGANGAGKTSLLRAMAGLLALSAGEATVLGHDPTTEVRALRRQVGLLGHRNGLYDDLSAQENLRFIVRCGRGPVSAVPQALERMGIVGRLATVPTSRLSAGQRRRVALAGVLARQPRLWLLDEPHAGLDAEHRQLLDQVLREQVSGGATVVLASHDTASSDALADRAVVMSGGTVLDGIIDDDPVDKGPSTTLAAEAGAAGAGAAEAGAAEAGAAGAGVPSVA
jgi:heme ABC exporter ATP-binding subunit CcmA